MSKTAIITGATSGIGAEYAKQLASLGYDLVITGRREEIIGKLADELKEKNNVKVDVVITELSEQDGVRKLIDFIAPIENIDMLINNAGFGLNKYFIRSDIDFQVRMNDVHTTASMKLIYAVLPKMIRQKHGNIINVASVAGMCPLVRDIVYCGSKAFLITFSEALYMEVMEKGIKIQALCPGFTHTDFHGKLELSRSDHKKMGKLNWMTSEEVVRYSLKRLKKNKVVCIPGFSNRLMVKATHLIPRSLYYKIIMK